MTVFAQLASFVILAAYIFACIRWRLGFREHLAFAVATLAVIIAALATGTDYEPVLPVLLVSFLVVAGINHGRDEGATREHLETTAGIAAAGIPVAAFDFDIDVLSKPTTVLIPETVDGPFTGRAYRALPDFVAQVEGHPRGLIVFLDDAERILSKHETVAYAEGRAEQGAKLARAWRLSPEGYVDGEDDDDPEQADAFTERPILSAEAHSRLAGPDAPQVRIDPADVLPLSRVFTEDEATRVLAAFDAFTEVRARPGMTALAILISLNVALETHGITITHHPKESRG